MAEPLARNGFNWSDPFLLEDQLSAEERMIRDSAAAFAADKLAPRIANDYLEERVDPTIFADFGAAGLLGATVPEEYGGLGLGMLELCVIAEEMGRALAP
ncbi:MAG TPA: acyl-CoA dehydrogenase, partial [Pelagibacterium sp.]|nr:acyl-CoA dehydrogenase [Pelagibacterium sp.]